MDQNKSSIGSIIGTIIIIALIILGGLYFWGKRVKELKNIENITTETTEQSDNSSEASVIMNTVSSSDDLSSIEADISSTNTTNLSSEVNP